VFGPGAVPGSIPPPPSDLDLTQRPQRTFCFTEGFLEGCARRRTQRSSTTLFSGSQSDADLYSFDEDSVYPSQDERCAYWWSLFEAVGTLPSITIPEAANEPPIEILEPEPSSLPPAGAPTGVGGGGGPAPTVGAPTALG
jgi:hypothetical protein